MALQAVLSELLKTLRASGLVQTYACCFYGGFAERLNNICQITVKEAKMETAWQAGVALLRNQEESK